MADWPWYLCLGCRTRSRANCEQHAGGGADETPYQTLTRYGSLELFVRDTAADEFRSLLRRDARADRLRIRTYAAPRQGDLTFVLAFLTDYSLSAREQSERMRKAMEGFSSA